MNTNAAGDSSQPLAKRNLAVVQEFQQAQNVQDLARCLALLDDEVVFDVGRGRYAGKPAVADFLKMLFRLETRGSDAVLTAEGDDRVLARWKNVDSDLKRIGLASLELQATYTLRNGRISLLQARPTAAALADLRAAQAAGGDAEGLRLAQAAGTLSMPERRGQ